MAAVAASTDDPAVRVDLRSFNGTGSIESADREGAPGLRSEAADRELGSVSASRTGQGARR